MFATERSARATRSTAHPDAHIYRVSAAMIDRRQLHGAYRAWLYRTQAWHVSFEEWKTDRDTTVELLAG
ncbi:MAG: hypothetical protein AAGH68_12795 [Pseudomonadota bacterium]